MNCFRVYDSLHDIGIDTNDSFSPRGLKVYCNHRRNYKICGYGISNIGNKSGFHLMIYTHMIHPMGGISDGIKYKEFGCSDHCGGITKHKVISDIKTRRIL